MTRLISLLALLVLTSSCASILSTKMESVSVVTNKPATIIVQRDTVRNTTQAHFKVWRSERDLIVSVENGNTHKDLFVNAGKVPIYWLNASPYPFFCLGLLIDLNTPKKYSYPRNIYVDMNAEGNQYTRYNPWSRKGDYNIHVSFPALSLFYYKPALGVRPERNLGVGGMTIGLDHYHKDFQFVNYSIGISNNYVQRLDPSVNRHPTTIINASFSVTNNHRAKLITAGYGISVIHHDREEANFNIYDPFEPAAGVTNTRYTSVGFAFPIYIQAGKNFVVGLNYQPSFFRFGDVSNFGYNYQLSLDLGWKIKI